MSPVGRSLDGASPWPAADEERYRHQGYWRDETLSELFDSWVERYDERLALCGGDERLTYRELGERVERLAGGFAALGIEAGDRVVVQLPNTVAFVVTLLALVRRGALPVLALPAHRRREISHFVAVSGAVAYVAADRHAGFDHRQLGHELLAGPTTLRHVILDGDPGDHLALESLPTTETTSGSGADRPDPATTALLLVSGGTTGKPKLIPRTHRDYAYNARASAEVCQLSGNDVYLVALPAGHNFPLACPGVLGALGVGAMVVMSPAPSPDVGLGLVERHGVTVTALVPPLARLWCDASGHDQRDRSTLRLLQVGGARLDAGLARRIGPELGCAVQQVFGMAEGLLNYTRLDDPDELVATTQGRPLSPADELLVVDEHDQPVAPGETGELLTRGPYTIRGYYRAPGANRLAFTPDGHYRTGDLVRQLPSGHLVVTGRVKEVVNRGGENVAAGELEEALVDHPAIAQAAVVGIPHDLLGEAVCAVVVATTAAPPPTLGQLRSHLVGLGLARFMMPDRLEVVEQLPLTAVGKIDKQQVVATVLDIDTRRSP